MIRQNTVFVIGAGASQPYGYPTGNVLRETILHDVRALKNLLPGDWHNAADDFKTTFERSSITSIDLFLSRNPEFINIGKPAIVKAIADSENGSRFREEMVDPKNPQDRRRDDWYSFIYQEMTKELTSKNDYGRLSENKVTCSRPNSHRILSQIDTVRILASKRAFAELICVLAPKLVVK